ncbi:hypothetical protein OG739_06260 [Streptomyces longwoodensis]|uniref:hypothetical protein n=1 Tax=Streptomyces longwoodensis TaxID=68231 RepID=UPI002DD9DDEB|nr:hypothetical protein [Streptomyces longwoodensis]WRY87193.1 hypothetical protein OG481_01065 [Streptomyces longwoodensis]WUC61151.1 hypothetical protein OHA09_30690 [Streptomyces longwoodensis]WUC74696.1 hypothetical protein OG416_29770 [Streptomyces longwoodensis]
MSIRKTFALVSVPAVLGGGLSLLAPPVSALATPQDTAAPAAAVQHGRPAAGLECGRNWPHHQYRKGGVSGAYTAFHLCWDNRRNARIDYSSSYVKDTRTDRHKAYVYVRYQKLNDGRWKREWTGPLAGAGPRNGGKAKFQWGNSSVQGVVVAVCAGTRAPWQRGSHCKLV